LFLFLSDFSTFNLLTVFFAFDFCFPQLKKNKSPAGKKSLKDSNNRIDSVNSKVRGRSVTKSLSPSNNRTSSAKI
jgi:hypothetical protein